jgi:hypothetical protein
MDQISDINIFSNSLFSNYKIGQVLSKVLVLSESKDKLILSIKPLLLHSIGDKQNQEPCDISFPSNFNELSPGQLIVGIVFKVEAYGVLVRFRNNVKIINILFYFFKF